MPVEQVQHLLDHVRIDIKMHSIILFSIHKIYSNRTKLVLHIYYSTNFVSSFYYLCIQFHYYSSYRYHSDPDMFKKFPPKIPWCNPLILSSYLCNNRKYLFFSDRSLDFILGISNYVIPVRFHFPDSVHNILTTISL